MGELPCQAPVFLERREKLAYVRARGKKLRRVDISPSRIPLEHSFKLLSNGPDEKERITCTRWNAKNANSVMSASRLNSVTILLLNHLCKLAIFYCPLPIFIFVFLLFIK